MPHYHVYGKIIFFDIPNNEYLLKLAYNLVSQSVTYRLGINLYANLSQELLEKFNTNTCREERYIPFELLDNPLTNECSEIFDGIWIGRHDLIGIENSRLPTLESFFAQMLTYEGISHLIVIFKDCHADLNAGMTEHEIEPNELCSVLTNAPRINTELPDVKLTVRRNHDVKNR